MSFTTQVKNEIINTQHIGPEKNKYILFGALCVALKINENKIEFVIKNDEIKQYINNLFYEVYNKNIEECDYKLISELFRNAEEQQYMIPNIDINNTRMLKYFLIGAYIGSGSLTTPSIRYHLEMKTGSEKLSYFVINILSKFSIKAKINVRKKSYYVYLKEAEQISDFLKLCGAVNALLQFEENRVVKDVRNNINRKVNCELANLNKVIETALKQQQDIILIKNKLGLSNLPSRLYEVAEIRLSDEQLSFSEIGDMLNPKISKSTVCKRLKKITEIAEELRGV